MKKPSLLISILMILCLTTACASKGSESADNAPKDSAASEQATAEYAAEADTAEETEESAAVSSGSSYDPAARGFYESERGWTVRYEPSLFSVEEDGDDVKFIYTGEAVGENLVEIKYIPDREPQEVLEEVLQELENEVEDISIEEDEGYFVENSWCYTANVEYSDDERDVTEVYQSAEYNGGVLMTVIRQGVTDENILEGFMGDALWDLLESLSVYRYEPQTQFADVPGTYKREGTDTDAVDMIVLKADHTGSLIFQDRIPVYWGSKAISEKNAEISYEYTLEGDTLLFNLDGTELKFIREQDQAAEVNPYIDPDYVTELNKEIDTLYNDASGKIGRVHKMQAFIMELSLHAKTQNPDFKVIVQNAAILGYIDGKVENGEQVYMKDLVDGYSVEGVVGKGESLEPGYFQEPYVDQAKRGKFVSDTTAVRSQEELDNYLARANAWGIVPFPKLGGELAQEILAGKRWADNGDYFWVEDPEILGVSDRIDGKRDVKELSDAQNFLYNINGRPYDNWASWDDEEAAFEKGDGDRTRITDSYACGLLVPSEDGKYTPVGEEDDETVADAIDEYGESWDWWWRAEGLDENAGRETWLETLRNSDYDVIYIDSFYNHRVRPEDQTPLTKEEVESLKYKPDGGRRQVIAYLAIGTAEQNRWYCQDDWIWIDPKNKNSTYSMKCGKVKDRGNDTIYIPFIDTAAAKEAGDLTEPPVWLAFDYGDEYPEEAVVQWWHDDWRNIIINGGGQYTHKVTGDNTSSVDRILEQGFDGVYLDNADSCVNPEWDAFEKYWYDRGGIPVSD